MNKEFDFLKERAKEFWERTLEDFQKERYNLYALDIEQSIQLYLKYLIAVKAGDFPKTHYLDQLFSEIASIYKENKILKIYQKNILQIRSLEDAYISSRYFPKKFNRIEIEKLKELAIKIFKYLEKITDEKFI